MRFCWLMIFCFFLVGCGFVQKKPYPKAQTLVRHLKVYDGDDIINLAEKMTSELIAYPPIKALLDNSQASIEYLPIENNTKYSLDNEILKSRLIGFLTQTGKFVGYYDKPLAQHFVLMTKLSHEHDKFIFSLSLKASHSDLVVWQDSMNLKIV